MIKKTFDYLQSSFHSTWEKGMMIRDWNPSIIHFGKVWNPIETAQLSMSCINRIIKYVCSNWWKQWNCNLSNTWCNTNNEHTYNVLNWFFHLHLLNLMHPYIRHQRARSATQNSYRLVNSFWDGIFFIVYDLHSGHFLSQFFVIWYFTIINMKFYNHKYDILQL